MDILKVKRETEASRERQHLQMDLSIWKLMQMETYMQYTRTQWRMLYLNWMQMEICLMR